MKFRVTMKNPDALYEAVEYATEGYLDQIEGLKELDLDEEAKDMLLEKKKEKLHEFAGKWMEYGEYITVEFDTEAGTATVIEKNK